MSSEQNGTERARAGTGGVAALTVYFDTSFYVRLVRDDQNAATKAIDTLRDHHVRPVLSWPLMSELAVKPDASAHRRLRSHVERLPPPLVLAEGMSWEWLVTDEEGCREIADFVQRFSRTEAEVNANSLAADRMTPTESAQVMARLNVPPEVLGPSPTEAYAAIRKMWNEQQAPQLRKLGHHVPDLPEEHDPAALLAIAEALKAQLPAGTFEKRETTQHVHAAVTRTDRRVVTAAVSLDPETLRSLGNALRDGDHMGEFLAHHERIDLLQVDGPRWKQIGQTPTHPIRLAGLYDRCLHGNDLESICQQVIARSA